MNTLRYIALILAISLITISIGFTSPPFRTGVTTIFAKSYTRCEAQVMLRSIELMYNNHVGNEWSFDVTVNGRKKWVSRYSSYETVFQDTFSDSVRLKIEATVIEDDKWDDVGSNFDTLYLSCPTSGESKKLLTFDVIVTENGGRYKGNKAKWRFNFQIVLEWIGVNWSVIHDRIHALHQTDSGDAIKDDTDIKIIALFVTGQADTIRGLSEAIPITTWKQLDAIPGMNEDMLYMIYCLGYDLG